MTRIGRAARSALLPAAAAVLALSGTALLLLPGGPPPSSADHPGFLAQSSPTAGEGPTPSPTPTPGSSTSHPEDDGHAHATWEVGQEPWRPVITGFLTDFTRPSPDWATRVTRWTSDYLSAEYHQLDLTRIPTAAVVDVAVPDSGEFIADVVATYDNDLVLLVRVEDSLAGWKITRVQPTKETAVNGLD